MFNSHNALIMVDIQNDFCPGGSLAVPEGDVIVKIANRLQAHFNLIVATQDWHPQNHMSFASNHPDHRVGDVIEVHGISQILWPDHCVQGSKGAAFHPDLATSRINKIFHKGSDKTVDSYSAFFDNEHLRATGLADYLREQNVSDIYIIGLATDYCVKYTCLDAVKLGFNTHIIIDACRGININPTDVQNALSELLELDVTIVSSDSILDVAGSAMSL